MGKGIVGGFVTPSLLTPKVTPSLLTPEVTPSLPHSLQSSFFKSLSNQLPRGEDVSNTVSPSFPEFQNNWNHGGQIYSPQPGRSHGA